jgi:ferredoxin
MPTIEFHASVGGPATLTDAPEGGALIDLCDEARAPVELSCRSANCGTCRVEVLDGAALLAPPGPRELDALSGLAASPTQRLACQAVVRAGGGHVLRWVQPQGAVRRPT